MTVGGAEESLSENAKLGEVLLEAGLIDEFQLAAALGEKGRWGHRLGETLVRLGYLTEAELIRTLSRHYGIPGIHLEGKQIEPEVLALLTAEAAEEYRCIPLFKKRISGGEVLYLGMAHPEDLRIIDDVSFRAGMPVRPVVVGPVQLDTAIASFYRGEHPQSVDGDAGASVLAETPVPDGDTAPVFSDLPELVAESYEDTGLEVEHADGDAASGVVEAEAEPPPQAVEKPREVPTRDILHALTQLLVEKDVVSRAELLQRIADNKKRSAH
jgi:type IV pilus assembly protein PilB